MWSFIHGMGALVIYFMQSLIAGQVAWEVGACMKILVVNDRSSLVTGSLEPASIV